MTKEKELEEQLLQAQKMEAVGTLVGGIAHDFNNMLAAIQGNIYMLRKNVSDDPKVAGRLDTIEKLSTRASDIVDQLLTFSHKAVVKMEQFSLNSFMEDGYNLTKSILHENIEHVCQVCEEELCIKGDITHLQQVLMNLLSNAVYAVKDTIEPKIVCALSKCTANDKLFKNHPSLLGKDFALLTVSDNGCGISEENLRKVFEPFFTTKGVNEGTGLGLAMVYGSIEAHGGVIDIESEVGKGTKFYMYFPLSHLSEVKREEESSVIIAGEDETILLVDDEDDLREAVGEVLTSMNYNVIVASNGKEAVEIFSENKDKISLVISDIVMPIMGGVEAAYEIRLLKRDVPIIFATGYDKNEMIGSVGEMERSMVLSKPFRLSELSNNIRSLIES